MNLDGTKLTTKKKVYSHWVIWISPFEQREPLDLFRKKKKNCQLFGFYGYLISVGPVSGSPALVSVALLCYEKTASNVVHS